MLCAVHSNGGEIEDGNKNQQGQVAAAAAVYRDLDLATSELDKISYGGLFESKRGMLSRPYISSIVKDMDVESQSLFLSKLDDYKSNSSSSSSSNSSSRSNT